MVEDFKIAELKFYKEMEFHNKINNQMGVLMTTASQTAETELTNGTWSNYTEGPPVQYKENEKKRGVKEWIQYNGDAEDPV